VGNISIALLSSLVILTLWILEFFALRQKPVLFIEMSKSFHIITYFAIGYSIFAFLTSLIREIIKDIEDIKGDKEENHNTLPIAIGIKSSNIFICIIGILTIIFLVLGQVKLFQNGFDIIAYYLIAVQVLFIYFLFLLFRVKSKKQFYYLSQMIKVIMVVGIFSMVLFP